MKKKTKKVKTKKNKFSLNKKVLAVTITGIFILALFFMFINNQTINATGHATLSEGLKSAGKGISETLGPVFRFLFGINEESGKGITQSLLSYILAFIIVLGIFWLALTKIDFFQERPKISNLIIFVISILTVRGLYELGVIKEIFFPYGVFGVVAVTALPFLAAFVLINMGLKNQAATMRRTLWILFAVVFIGFWIIRRDEITTLRWIYFATAALAILMAFIDGTIKGFFTRIEAEKLENINKADIRGKLMKAKRGYQEMYENDQLSKSDYDALIKNLQKKARVYGIKGHM